MNVGLQAGEKIKLKLKLGRGGTNAVRGALAGASVSSPSTSQTGFEESSSSTTSRLVPGARVEPRVPPLHISLKKGRSGSPVVLEKGEESGPSTSVPSGLETQPRFVGSDAMTFPLGTFRVNDSNKIRRGKPLRGRLKDPPTLGRGAGRGVGVGLSAGNNVMNDAVLVADNVGVGRGMSWSKRKAVNMRSAIPGAPARHISTAVECSTTDTLTVTFGVANRHPYGSEPNQGEQRCALLRSSLRQCLMEFLISLFRASGVIPVTEVPVWPSMASQIQPQTSAALVAGRAFKAPTSSVSISTVVTSSSTERSQIRVEAPSSDLPTPATSLEMLREVNGPSDSQVFSSADEILRLVGE